MHFALILLLVGSMPIYIICQNQSSIFVRAKDKITSTRAVIYWIEKTNFTYNFVIARTNNCVGGYQNISSPFTLDRTSFGGSELLKPTVEYNVTLCEVGSDGSVTAYYRTVRTAPPPPSNFTLENSTSHALVLKWNHYNISILRRMITSYNITYRARNTNINDVINISVPSTQTEIELMQLTSNTEYIVTLTGVVRANRVYTDLVTRIFKTDLDDCSMFCHSNASCSSTAEYQTCSCNYGFIGDGYNCDELRSPKFQAFVLNSISIEVKWLSKPQNFSYFLIRWETETDHFEQNISMVEKPLVFSGLNPNTNYTITARSVAGNQSSPEEIKHIFLVTREVCNQTVITQQDTGRKATFPTTQVGYRSTSIEKCNSENNVPLATITCHTLGYWLEPNWISSCEITLKNLLQADISSEEEQMQVATDLVVLTSNSSDLSSELVSFAVNSVANVVNFNVTLNQNVATNVLEAVGNILEAPQNNLNLEDSKSLLSTLGEVTQKVVLEDGGKYQATTSTVALAVVQNSNQNGKLSGIGFGDNLNQSLEQQRFRIEQFQILTPNSTRKSTSIFIPKEAVALSRDGRVAFLAFADNTIFVSLQNTSSTDESTTLRSVPFVNILSASVFEKVENLSENVSMIFEYDPEFCPSNQTDDCGEYFCGFWNESQLAWSQDGCTLVNKTDKYIECQCNHLTNFALLFAHKNAFDTLSLSIFTYVGCSLSVFGSVATIVALIIDWNSKRPSISTTTAFVMINLALSFSFLYEFLLVSTNPDVQDNENACIAIAAVLHFSLFSSLFWTLADAIYICLGVTAPLFHRTRLTFKRVAFSSVLLGWGIPALFIAISVGIDHSTYQRNANMLFEDSMQTENRVKICFITENRILYFVVIPASVIVAVNLLLYIVTVLVFNQQKKVGNPNKITLGKNIAFSFTLFFLFGLTWIFGFLLFDSSIASQIFAYIFTITISLQGLFIFLLFVVRNKKIIQNIKAKFVAQ